MVILVPLGVMNLAAMAGRTLVIFVEKLWSRGPLLSTESPSSSWPCWLFQDGLLPGLQAPAPAMDDM
jgi:predicted metal-binding membrane protein